MISVTLCRIADFLHRIHTSSLAPSARFGADSAMLVHGRVALAFLSASAASKLAQFERHTQHGLVAAGSTGGQCAGGRANIGAVQIESNALSQPLNHLLRQTGIGTTDARLRALEALFDAFHERLT
jgi:hypothetical protein